MIWEISPGLLNIRILILLKNCDLLESYVEDPFRKKTFLFLKLHGSSELSLSRVSKTNFRHNVNLEEEKWITIRKERPLKNTNCFVLALYYETKLESYV